MAFGAFWGAFQRVIPHLFQSLRCLRRAWHTQAQRRSAVFLSFKPPISCLPLHWEQPSKLLPTVARIPASKVSKWSTDEVYITFSVCQGVERAVLV